MSSNRWDETWHRLREWTSGQAPSERLAAQVLLHEGFTSIDPSHPLGGRDGGKDAICTKGADRWVMAVYFARGQGTFAAIQRKFTDDVTAARARKPNGFAFVTNQELTLAERKSLVESATPLAVDLYHLERITAILDSPSMAEVRKQFLGIEQDDQPLLLLGGQGGLAPGAAVAARLWAPRLAVEMVDPVGRSCSRAVQVSQPAQVAEVRAPSETTRKEVKVGWR